MDAHMLCDAHMDTRCLSHVIPICVYVSPMCMYITLMRVRRGGEKENSLSLSLPLPLSLTKTPTHTHTRRHDVGCRRVTWMNKLWDFVVEAFSDSSSLLHLLIRRPSVVAAVPWSRERWAEARGGNGDRADTSCGV
jgi:hypothetical protein